MVLWVERRASAAALTHGPILGAVTDTSIRVWGRTDQAATLTVAYAPTAGGTERAASTPITCSRRPASSPS